MNILNKWYEEIKKAQSVESLEKIRISVFGKKGVLAKEFAKMKTAPNEEKGKIAKDLNTHKLALMNELQLEKLHFKH